MTLWQRIHDAFHLWSGLTIPVSVAWIFFPWTVLPGGGLLYDCFLTWPSTAYHAVRYLQWYYYELPELQGCHNQCCWITVPTLWTQPAEARPVREGQQQADNNGSNTHKHEGAPVRRGWHSLGTRLRRGSNKRGSGTITLRYGPNLEWRRHLDHMTSGTSHHPRRSDTTARWYSLGVWCTSHANGNNCHNPPTSTTESGETTQTVIRRSERHQELQID